jgi:hypothetical protein
MRHWKHLLLAFTVSLPPTILYHPALAQTAPCDRPNEASAETVAQAIQSVCILAKQAVPEGHVNPALGEEVNESIRVIGGRLQNPNPFGRCWYDSRYDCLKAKEAVGILTQQVGAFQDIHYVSPDTAAATRSKRLAITNSSDELVDNIHSFCNTLRH